MLQPSTSVKTAKHINKLLHQDSPAASYLHPMSGCGQACSSGGGCQPDGPTPGSFGSWARRHGNKDGSEQGSVTSSVPQPSDTPSTCMKCKSAPAVTTVRQNEPYCNDCIEAGVQQKCRAATKGVGLISTGDHALLALSGGAASAALLYCLSAMQAAADSKRPDRGKVAFQLAVLHVDCSMRPTCATAQAVKPAAAVQGVEQQPPVSSDEAQQEQQLRDHLSALVTATGFHQDPLLLHLSDIFCTNDELQQLLSSQQQQQQPDCSPVIQFAQQLQPQGPEQQQQQRMQQLQHLFAALLDPTGREDLMTYLRDNLLQRAAAVLGCRQLLRGDCASRVAVRIIAEAAKGRGFSLPADLQMFDGRLLPQHGLCVLQPLREITRKEVQQLCRFKQVPLLQQDQTRSCTCCSTSAGPCSCSERRADNINVLSECFVQEMETSLPASIYTIIRTAAHLEPFEFTDAAALVPQAAAAMKRHHRHQQQSSTQGSDPMSAAAGCTHQRRWQFCSICKAPLPVALAAVPSASGDVCGDVHGDVHGYCTAQASQCPVGCRTPDKDGSSEGSTGSDGKAIKSLCYSCNKQIAQQVKVQLEGCEGASKSSVMWSGRQGLLELKMLRLRQLLPPGMLLESDSDDI